MRKTFYILLAGSLALVTMVTAFFIFKAWYKPSVIDTSFSLIKMEVPDLIREADTIVIGSVEKKFPPYKGEIRGEREEDPIIDMVFSETIIKVERYLKNPQPEEEITIVTYGGEVGDIVVHVGAGADFEPGEKVLVFLIKRPQLKGKYEVCGMLQGKYSIKGEKAINKDSSRNTSLKLLEDEIERALKG